MARLARLPSRWPGRRCRRSRSAPTRRCHRRRRAPRAAGSSGRHRAEAVDRLGQFELHAGALGEALAAERDEAVRPHLLRQREPAAISMAGQITTWKRVMSLPMTCTLAGQLAPRSIGKNCAVQIVGQRVEPDVGACVSPSRAGGGKGTPQAEARAAGGDVLEPLGEQAEDLVAARGRLQELRMRREVRLEGLGVAREAEEPVALGDFLERARGMQRATAVGDVRRLLEALAADAVHPGVGALVEVVGAVREYALEQVLHGRVMLGGRGTHKLVVRDAEALPHRGELSGDVVHEGLRCEAGLLGRLRDLLAVLVHPDEEPDVVAHLAVEAADGVGADLLQGVPEVRLAVGVINGAGEVEACHGQASVLGGADGPPRPRRPPRRPRRRRRLGSASSASVSAAGCCGRAEDGVVLGGCGATLATVAGASTASSSDSSSAPSSASASSSSLDAARCNATSAPEAAAASSSPGTMPGAVSLRSCASGMVRNSPSAVRSVTRSRKMSLLTIFSSPRPS
jgi:hypothetical protein